MIFRRGIIAALAVVGAADLGRAQIAGPRPSGGQLPRLGVLMGLGADDPEARFRKAALEQGLREAGWKTETTCILITAGLPAIRSGP